jgi:hypothetical protein
MSGFTLSSSPVGAFGQGATLLVGLEDQPDGTVRAYLGHRRRGVYVVLSDAAVASFRAAWASGGHVWLSPVPPQGYLHRDDPDEQTVAEVERALDEDADGYAERCRP